ncbi:MAG: transporter, partial [Rhodospirillaceae bacterium]
MVDYIDKPAYVMIGEPFWGSLSDAEKAMVKKAQAASRELVRGLLPDQQKKFLADMEKRGVTITYPDKAEFIAATQPVR